MKLHLAIAIAAVLITTLTAQTSAQVPLTVPQQPIVELLDEIPDQIVDTKPLSSSSESQEEPAQTSGSLTLAPLQRSFPGYGGEALDETSVTGVYFMTNLNASGPGSLTAAPSNAYIVPLVAGEIKSDIGIVLSQSNVRFLGQLAPGRISLDGSSVYNNAPLVEFNGSNTLWQYLTLKSGDSDLGAGIAISHSPFTVRRGAVGVVLANMSVHYGDDDNGSVWDTGTSDVTFYRMLVAFATDRGALGGNVDYGFINGGGSKNVSVFQNLFVVDGRAPLMQNTTGQVDNNITYTGSGVTNQLQSSPAAAGLTNAQYNYTNNLNISNGLSGSQGVWLGQHNTVHGVTPPTHSLRAYLANNNFRRCSGGGYLPMITFTSNASNDAGGDVTPYITNTPFNMPTLPSITDPATLESTLIPVVGNSLYRDAIDTDIISIVSSCEPKPNETTASNYFANPWPTGPTKEPITIWDTASPDGLSDSAKAVFGFPPGANLLSPNDGRWEAVVQHYTGLL